LPKKIAKKLAFLTQNKAKLCKILIITLVFEKNANFFAENWQKSQKIVIITSTPGHPGVRFPSLAPFYLSITSHQKLARLRPLPIINHRTRVAR
jgi:hypothetical protein